MLRLVALLLTVLLVGACSSSEPTRTRLPTASDGCGTLAEQIAGASPAPEPKGRTDTLTGLRPVSRSGDVTAHSAADPLEAVQVLTGQGATEIQRASLLFAFSESGRATFGGCVATNGRVGTKTVPVADPDPASPLTVALYQVLVGRTPANSDLSAPIAMMNANGKPPRMFGDALPGALPPLVTASFDSPSRLALKRDPNAKCEPRCLDVGIFVFDVQVAGTALTGKQVLGRVGVAVPVTGLAVGVPAAGPRTLRVAVIVSGTGVQTNADPMYAFTAQTKP